MKKIEAILREEDFEKIKKTLKEAGFIPLTAFPVKGRGVQGGVPPYDMLPKIKLEIVAKDEDVSTIVGIIAENARSGTPGDGKIFILPVEEAIRIRTGESGDKALY